MSSKTTSANTRLPSVTSDIPRDLRFFLDRVRETLVTEGRVGEIVDRRISRGGSGSGGSGIVDAPTAPRELRAIGQALSIDVTWAPADYRGHQHTEIWVADRDDLNAAQAVGIAPGTFFNFLSPANEGRYIWARFVNQNGVPGPYNNQAGTYAVATEVTFSPPSLDDTWLSQELRKQLPWIDDPTFGLRDRFDLLWKEVDRIYAEVDMFRSAPNWTSAIAWDKGAVVQHEGSLYVALQNVPAGTQITNTAYWQKIGEYKTLSVMMTEAIGAAFALTARVSQTEDEYHAIATALLSTGIAYTGPDGLVYATDAALGLLSEITDINGEITALSTLLNAVAAVVSTPTGQLMSAQALHGLTARVTTAEGNITTLAENYNGVKTFLVGPTGSLGESGAFTSLRSQVTNIDGRLTATSNKTDAIDASITYNGQRFSAAAYSTWQASVDSNLSSQAQQLSGIQAGAGNGGNLLADAVFQTRVGVSWQFTWSGDYDIGVNLPNWTLTTSSGERTAYMFYKVGGNVPTFAIGRLIQTNIPVVAGQRYQFSCYLGIHRTRADLNILWYGSGGNYLGSSAATPITNYGSSGGASLAGYQRIFGFAPAPNGAATARFELTSSYPGSAVSSPYLFMVRPFFGLASATQTEPSPWAPGLEPPVFAAMQQDGMVWADASGEGNTGATYTMKLRAKDNTGEAQVGFGMSVLKENGAWVADVRFSADRFAIMSPGLTGVAAYPFIVSGGIVYMNSAQIQNASITTAKIANAAITNAKIANASVDTLTLAGNAVTVPTYLSSTASYTGNGNVLAFTDLNITISNPHNTTMAVMVLFSARQGYTAFSPSAAAPRTAFAVMQDGVYISLPATPADGCVAYTDYLVWACRAIVPAFGVSVFTPHWYGQNNTVFITGRSFLVLGVKR